MSEPNQVSVPIWLFVIPVAAFFLMLFLGNLGLNLGFFGCIPGAMVLSTLRTRTSPPMGAEARRR